MNEKKAERVVNTFTGPWEKRILPKLALSLPAKVVPDHLTGLALLATLLIGGSYILSWHSRYWLFAASFGFVLHWFGDSLDGTLARVRKVEREHYGYFVDHICDAFSTVFICLAFGLSPFMQFEVGALMAIGYLLLNIYSHVGAYTKGEFRISFFKMGPTEIRIVLIIINTILFFWNPKIHLSVYDYLTFVDLAGIAFAAIFAFVFVYNSIKTAIFLDKFDRQK